MQRSSSVSEPPRDRELFRRFRSPATPIAVGYVLLSTLWILGSDWAASFLESRERYEELQTLKGWLFVGVTGVLLWTILHGYWRARIGAQEREARSERRLEAALETLRAAFLQIESREPHAILLVSEGIHALLGYSPEELVASPGHRAQDVVHAEDRRLLSTAMRASAQDGRAFAFELRLVSRQGEVRWAWCKGRPLPGGEAVEMFLTDVSRLKQLEARLLEAQGTEALAELAAGVAHDVNNFLTAITGYGELLEHSLAGAGLQGELPSEHVAQIREAARRGHALNQRLMSLGRSSHGEQRKVDLNQIVEDAGSLLRPMLRRRVTLECQVPTEPVLVEGDPHQLERVVVNLAVNARDAMPDGGQLRLTAAVREGASDPGLARLELPPGAYGCLSVTDTGTGIPPEAQERIFTPFFTTKPGGTGLGLAVAAGLVEQNGGRILVESTPGTGTRFEIVLPLAKGTAPEDTGTTEEGMAGPLWAWDLSHRRRARRG